MAKLTDEMKEFVKGKLAYVATIGADGLPNVGPKGGFQVIDDEHLGWTEATFKNTYENVQKNAGVAIAVVERETRKGYRFKGQAEVLTSGPVYEKIK
ncbi:MAG: pyridoxamine 5'-phosphate oxidase family protein, partial [Dehalococcoidia bacterium]|nr:pyridoxamine 5'-phosphate oxidase family protein [Dehalococcoidia bacterium]